MSRLPMPRPAAVAGWCRSHGRRLRIAATPVAPVESQDVERRNWFDDPFFQIASGLPGCPVPLGPFYTEAERRTQMHSRLERGTSCWLEHRCEDSNAYRYDKDVAPRVRDALSKVPGHERASVWAMVQRRWVYLQGCVPSQALAHAAGASRPRGAGRGDRGARPDGRHARPGAVSGQMKHRTRTE